MAPCAGSIRLPVGGAGEANDLSDDDAGEYGTPRLVCEGDIRNPSTNPSGSESLGAGEDRRDVAGESQPWDENSPSVSWLKKSENPDIPCPASACMASLTSFSTCAWSNPKASKVNPPLGFSGSNRFTSVPDRLELDWFELLPIEDAVE